MCVCYAGIIERLCVEIDGFNVCVLLEIIERVYAEIDGFNVCVFCSEIVICCRNCVGCSELTFIVETELSTMKL
jgi:hypothetical protein